jgi:hypothetical protein
MFAENLKKAMDTSLFNATDLSKACGISHASISGYLAGRNVPRKDKLEKIACVLNVDTSFLLHEEADEGELLNRCRMTVAEAARLMGVCPQFVRRALQQRLLPFGFAMKTTPNSQKMVYYISRKKFTEYTGIDFHVKTN